MTSKSVFNKVTNALASAGKACSIRERRGVLKRVVKSAAIASLGVTHFAIAASIGKVAQNMSGNFNYVGLAAQGFFAVCGVVLIGMSVFTLIKYNKTDGQGAKLSTAAIYLVGGGLLFYIASLITTAGDTVWGDGGGDRSRVTIQQ